MSDLSQEEFREKLGAWAAVIAPDIDRAAYDDNFWTFPSKRARRKLALERAERVLLSLPDRALEALFSEPPQRPIRAWSVSSYVDKARGRKK
jgi:hypothetical protein